RGFQIIDSEALILCSRECNDPFSKREILKKPAHQSQLEMTVHVYEAGQDGCARKAHCFRAGKVGPRLSIEFGAGEADSIAVDYDCAVAHGRRTDRQHPISGIDSTRHIAETIFSKRAAATPLSLAAH